MSLSISRLFGRVAVVRMPTSAMPSLSVGATTQMRGIKSTGWVRNKRKAYVKKCKENAEEKKIRIAKHIRREEGLRRAADERKLANMKKHAEWLASRNATGAKTTTPSA